MSETTMLALIRAQETKITELRGLLDQAVERGRRLAIENYHLRLSVIPEPVVVPVQVDPLDAAVAEAAQVGRL